MARGSTTPAPLPGPRRPELELGTEVGRYKIIRLLGHGGMGAVYAAHDPKLDRQVALKLLHSTHGFEAAERMVREAKALARLDDRHVVQVFDAGEYRGQVFIAMQLIDGEDLAEALARKKPSVPQILAWFCDAGRGLVAAHAAGLIHRDFKPTNVLVDRRGHVAVTDFGLARGFAGTDDDGEITKIGALMGTPAYMSPEQHATQPATPASDQFSFCVSLWEALFDRHPFIPGDRSAISGMSPFAIGYHIYEGALVPPPPTRGVPRRVIEALSRGLSRDPATRWPSMTTLLDELAPAIKRRRTWPIVLGVGIAAAAAGGGAVWFVARDSAAGMQACARQSADRAQAVWSPSAARQLQAQFARSERPYVDAAAQQARVALDRYASRWQQLATDVCDAERSSPASSELIVRRHACLDRRLDSLRTLVTMFTGEARPAYVDRAQQMVDSLPDLGDCVDESLPSIPPPAIASDVARLDRELAKAEALGGAGDFAASRDEATRLLAEADKLEWAPLQARAHFAIGRASQALLLPARDDLVQAAELASAAGMDRDAARAWILSQQAAGFEQSADAHAMLSSIARASAARTGDQQLVALAELKRARGLLRLRQWTAGAAGCKAAFEAAQTLENGSVLDEARDCMLESLVPLGETAPLEQLLADILAAKTKDLGDEHPTIADYLRVRAQLHLREGRLAEARQDTDRMLAIRTRTYPAGHYKLAEGLAERANLLEAEGDKAGADAARREALAMLDENRSDHILLMSSLLVNVATREVITGSREEGLARFDRAARLVRKRAGDNSLELAFLLLNYGQFKARVNVEAGLGLIGEAREILEHHKDRRLPVASIAAAIIASNAKRYDDVVRIGDETLPLLGPDDDPEQIATMKWLLARALVQTKGDEKRVRTLATEAREIFVKLGPALADDVKAIDKLLATLR